MAGGSDNDATEGKRLRKAIGQIKGQFTRAERYAQEQEEQLLIDTEDLKVRIEELQSGLHNYKSLSLQLLMLTDEEPTDDDDLEEKYFRVMSKLRKLLCKTHTQETCEPAQVSQKQPNRLPILDIAQFDGKKITEYKSFIDIFKAIVDQDASLTPVQKLFYLKKYLKDDALLLIDSLPLVNDSYAQALQLLDKRYDNKCLVITHHVNALLDSQPISRGNSSEFRHFVSVVRQHLGALNNLGQQTQHWDMIIVPIILRKLDSLSSRIYYSERDATILPNIEGLLSFIERRAMSFEESQMSPGKSTTYKFNNNKSVSLTNTCEQKLKTCLFCKKAGHKLFACKEFQALSTQDRISFANDETLCQICLNKHSNKCQFHFKCFMCKSKTHNSLLHTENNASCNFSKSSINKRNSMILLPTIKVHFKAKDGTDVTARGLVDSGSQVSFINKKIFDKLNIPSFNYDVNVTALGRDQKPITKAVNLTMHSRHNNFRCNTFFSVVDNITSFLPQTKFDLSDIAIPSFIDLADDEFNMPGEIQFLVSANIFFKILLPAKISLSEDLFLLATKYGYIVAGDVNKEYVPVLRFRCGYLAKCCPNTWDKF